MVETDRPTGPLAFAASFPPEERFASTAADLAAKLAGFAGCPEPAAREIRAEVETAFRAALARGRANGASIDLGLRASDSVLETDLRCGRVALLHCSRAITT